MPNYKDIINEIRSTPDQSLSVRTKYLRDISEKTGRNTIAYYSAFIPNQVQASEHGHYYSINDNDVNSFMQILEKVVAKKGLDLILHTPGGGITATECIVNYLKLKFGNNIRAIVPQAAFSAGTMIALACSEIIMGNHSSLGPIDPSLGGYSVYNIIRQFEQAKKEIIIEPRSIHYWSPILSKYSATMLEDAIHTKDLAEELSKSWLIDNMFSNESNSTEIVEYIFSQIGTRDETLDHSRHLSKQTAREIGLKIVDLEEDQDLQEKVLSFHHSVMASFELNKSIIKIVQNQNGVEATLTFA